MANIYYIGKVCIQYRSMLDERSVVLFINCNPTSFIVYSVLRVH